MLTRERIGADECHLGAHECQGAERRVSHDCLGNAAHGPAKKLYFIQP